MWLNPCLCLPRLGRRTHVRSVPISTATRSLGETLTAELENLDTGNLVFALPAKKEARRGVPG
jgi:hypothetical protein